MFATVVLAAGLALVWVRVVQTLTAPSNAPKAVGQPGALVWDGRVFTSSAQLKAYLTSRGLSYSRWAARHPTAFGATAPTVTTHATTKRATTKTVKPKPSRSRSRSRAAVGRRRRRARRSAARVDGADDPVPGRRARARRERAAAGALCAGRRPTVLRHAGSSHGRARGSHGHPPRLRRLVLLDG